MERTRLSLRRDPHFKRRRRTAVALVIGIAGVITIAQGGFASRTRIDPPRSARLEPAGHGSNPIVDENRKAGTDSWHISRESGSALEGFASATSVRPGGRLDLYISSDYPAFTLAVYRMGWYQGHKARLVWIRRDVPGIKQPRPTVDADTRMVDTNWTPTVSLHIGSDWTTGEYLAKLAAPDGRSHYVPFVVRESDGHRAPIVFQSSVATWQAYNTWGGHSLYLGKSPHGAENAAQRSTVVSFDRPYDKGAGASDFLGLELPLASWMEQQGFDIGYATDIDTHSDDALLEGRRAFLSLGHDEYWSTRMRDNVEYAADRGVNLAFFGANALYRHVRFEPSQVGPDRREVNYRSTRDPIANVDPSETTVQWRDPPVRRPEDAVLGAMYECNPVHSDAIVYDPLPWLFRGTELSTGDRVTGLVGPEYDRIFGDRTHPTRIWVLFRSPVSCGSLESVQDTTFARFPSGAGVFDAGTSAFLCAFSGCPRAPVDERVQLLVRNLLDAYIATTQPSSEPDPRPFSVHPARVRYVYRAPAPTDLFGRPIPTPREPSITAPPEESTPRPYATAPPPTRAPRGIPFP